MASRFGSRAAASLQSPQHASSRKANFAKECDRGSCELKACVITPRYTISGVALAQFRFARALARRGYDVDLIVGRVDADLTVPDAPGVKVIALQRRNVRGLFLPF